MWCYQFCRSKLFFLFLPCCLLIFSACSSSTDSDTSDTSENDTASGDTLNVELDILSGDSDQDEESQSVEVEPDDSEEADVVEVEHEPLPSGDRILSGRAYFFIAENGNALAQAHDVEGAEVFVFEHPELRTEANADGEFQFEGLPDDIEITLALQHGDYFPVLTGVIQITDEDITNITFQVISHELAQLAGLLLGIEPYDSDTCQMATTVASISDSQDTIWAPGEPGATVTVDPPVEPSQGPIYFNTMVMPDVSLSETSTDGGVTVVDVEPGFYIWNAHKEGVEFTEIKLRCEPGWLTNASPPRGIQAF